MNLSNKKIFFVFLIILLVVCSGCITPSNDDNNSKKDTLIWAVLTPESIYPLDVTSDNFWTIIPNVFNGLVDFDEDFRIIPSLAVSWNNPDNITWRFSLRQGVTFHDGNNFTAEDVKFSLENSTTRFDAIIKEILILDNHTIEFKTYEPTPNLLSRLAHTAIIYCKNNAEQPHGPRLIGTGPYRLADYEIDTYTALERFDGYWGEKPEIKTVIFKAMDDTEERLNALRSGAIDIAEYNIDDSIDQIMQEENITVVKFPPLSIYFIGFDMRENGSYGFPDGKNPTADVRVPKAIYQAIDIDPLINGPFKGFAQPESQLVTSYIFGYNPEINRLPYNLSSSRQLLEEAGYKQGFCYCPGLYYRRFSV